MELEVGDIVLCTVERIERTIVFVDIETPGKKLQGSIVMSEIAPGRIRNVRDYVVPKKKIVCKVLRISGDRIDLSLRRVTQKEQKEIMSEFKQEKSYSSVLKSVLGKEDAKKAIKEIQKENKLYDFLQEAKEDSKALEKVVGKENSEKILEIIKAEKKKKAILKKEFSLTTTLPNGLEIIKELLGNIKDSEVKVQYISAGKYSIKAEAATIKEADNKISEILKGLEEKSKVQDIVFRVKEKK